MKYGPKNGYRAVINHKPFSIDFFRDNELHVKLNGKGLMNMEHWRPKVDKAGQKEGAESVSIYLPPGELYYDYFTYDIYHGSGTTITIDAPLDKIPLLMKADHIIPRKDRPRRSSGFMRHDPYTFTNNPLPQRHRRR